MFYGYYSGEHSQMYELNYPWFKTHFRQILLCVYSYHTSLLFLIKLPYICKLIHFLKHCWQQHIFLIKANKGDNIKIIIKTSLSFPPPQPFIMHKQQSNCWCWKFVFTGNMYSALKIFKNQAFVSFTDRKCSNSFCLWDTFCWLV